MQNFDSRRYITCSSSPQLDWTGVFRTTCHGHKQSTAPTQTLRSRKKAQPTEWGMRMGINLGREPAGPREETTTTWGPPLVAYSCVLLLLGAQKLAQMPHLLVPSPRKPNRRGPMDWRNNTPPRNGDERGQVLAANLAGTACPSLTADLTRTRRGALWLFCYIRGRHMGWMAF
ncbi:hypothetical protein F4802DRAFT_442947 [Xylaria palmicola]|nr:hypothetical protein F4802DRAFT_442947 [Xylaria palmicola]